MATIAFNRIRQLEGYPGITVTSKGEALEVTLRRGDIEVRVVVPEDVLEWFVDVELRTCDSRASDWLDYLGYADTSVSELEKEMAEDVESFLNQVSACDLRFVVNEKNPAGGILEWYVDGGWRQAIPFRVPAT